MYAYFRTYFTRKLYVCFTFMEKTLKVNNAYQENTATSQIKSY